MKKMMKRLMPCALVLLMVFLLAAVASAGMNVQTPQTNVIDRAVIAPNQGAPANVPAVQSPVRQPLRASVSCRFTINPPSPIAGGPVQPVTVMITNTGTIAFAEHTAEFNCIGCGFEMTCPTCKNVVAGSYTPGVKAFSRQWTVPMIVPGATSTFMFNPMSPVVGAPALWTPGPYTFACFPDLANKAKFEQKTLEVKAPAGRAEPKPFVQPAKEGGSESNRFMSPGEIRGFNPQPEPPAMGGIVPPVDPDKPGSAYPPDPGVPAFVPPPDADKPAGQ